MKKSTKTKTIVSEKPDKKQLKVRTRVSPVGEKVGELWWELQGRLYGIDK